MIKCIGISIYQCLFILWFEICRCCSNTTFLCRRDLSLFWTVFSFNEWINRGCFLLRWVVKEQKVVNITKQPGDGHWTHSPWLMWFFRCLKYNPKELQLESHDINWHWYVSFVLRFASCVSLGCKCLEFMCNFKDENFLYTVQHFW